jgi:prevent-host-death family protein
MVKTVLTVSEVNQDFARAQRAVAKGPVIITYRGEPSLVLMTYKSFQAKTSTGPTLLERLHVDGVDDIKFEPPRLLDGSMKAADFG